MVREYTMAVSGLPKSIPGENRGDSLHDFGHVDTRKGVTDERAHPLHMSDWHQEGLEDTKRYIT